MPGPAGSGQRAAWRRPSRRPKQRAPLLPRTGPRPMSPRARLQLHLRSRSRRAHQGIARRAAGLLDLRRADPSRFDRHDLSLGTIASKSRRSASRGEHRREGPRSHRRLLREPLGRLRARRPDGHPCARLRRHRAKWRAPRSRRAHRATHTPPPAPHQCRPSPAPRGPAPLHLYVPEEGRRAALPPRRENVGAELARPAAPRRTLVRAAGSLRG